MGARILIIEDDIDISLMIKEYLSKEGHCVLINNSGLEGLETFKKEEVDIVILDVMIPDMDGYSILSNLRKMSCVPVIMLTAKGSQMDKIIGFKKGCDDYIVKPFDLIELNLRINAILRRGSNINQSKSTIIYKDLTVDKEAYSVYKSEKEIKFTRKEFDILLLLLENKGKIYTSEMIYNIIWNEDYLENDNSVITHIRNIREKLGDKVKESIYIKTIWGVGYKIEKDI